MKTFTTLNYNPVSNLPSAYASLNTSQAIQVGGLFASISAALSTLGVYLLIEGSAVGSLASLSIDDLLPFFFSFLILFASLAISHFLARFAFERKYSFAPDIFVSGVCSLPFGVASLASGIVGIFSYPIVLALMFSSLFYVMMIIYSSLTKMSNVPTQIAIPIVPLIVIGCSYLSRSFLFVFVL